jgi:predicted RNA binding protein YcfA (HicA-like mRNA interferase family)
MESAKESFAGRILGKYHRTDARAVLSLADRLAEFCFAKSSSGANIHLVKIRDIINLIEQDGWFLIVTRGSHRQYKHPAKLGRVTIAGHPNDDLAPGTLNSILKQAQLKGEK